MARSRMLLYASVQHGTPDFTEASRIKSDDVAAGILGCRLLGAGSTSPSTVTLALVTR